MIYYCSIYSANMSSTNALQVARTDIQSGEKTESLSKLKLSTWWPIHAHANTYARLGSGAPQLAQMRFSLFCNNSFISFAIFAGRQRWMWVDNISETAMTLISKKLESLREKITFVFLAHHVCIIMNIYVSAQGWYRIFQCEHQEIMPRHSTMKRTIKATTECWVGPQPSVKWKNHKSHTVNL